MKNQTRLPDEIVIVDGGSKDGTWEFLKSYTFDNDIQLVAIQDAGCNVARGRNIAIVNATNEI
ncbi:MAG: glycosyltransferase, partial [Planctomycetota bacterium]